MPNTSFPVINRKNATVFIIHLLGDDYQPLHATGILRGGNDIMPVCWRRQLNGRGIRTGQITLHSVGDPHIPHRIGDNLPAHLSIFQARPWAGYLRQTRARVNETAGQCVDLATPEYARWGSRPSPRPSCTRMSWRGSGCTISARGRYFGETWEVVDDATQSASVRLGAC